MKTSECAETFQRIYTAPPPDELQLANAFTERLKVRSLSAINLISIGSPSSVARWAVTLPDPIGPSEKRERKSYME